MELNFLFILFFCILWLFFTRSGSVIDERKLKTHSFTSDKEAAQISHATTGFKYRKKPQWVIDELLK